MKQILSFLICFVLVTNSGFSQNRSIKPIIIKANYFDISPPLRDMVHDPHVNADMTWKDGIVKNNLYPEGIFPDNLNTSEEPDPSTIQSFKGSIATDTTELNFDGLGSDNGVIPPDTDGDVGPNHYFQVVNVQYAIYNKSGVKVFGPYLNSSIFQGLPNNYNDGDAIVLYDEIADRWLFSQFSLPNYPNGPFYQNVAVSQTADPTGAWYRYQFAFDDLPDYPKLSVWTDGYYLTINRFSAGSINYEGTGAAALPRDQMLAGVANVSMVYFILPFSNPAYFVLSADCDGEFPPSGTPCYLAYTKPSDIHINEFRVDWLNTANSAYTESVVLPVSSYSSNMPQGIPQKGTSVMLDPLSGRLMFRLQFRKFSDHWSMVASGTVRVGEIAGIRWYEFRKTGTGQWSVYQQSTYLPDNNHRWMGSIAMDSSGTMALGYSISGENMYPSIRYCGRFSSDPLNEMTIAEKSIMNGGGSQTNTWSGNLSRWGDYSSMSVDPSEPATFWYTQEYYSSSSEASWKTRIGSFRFPKIFSATASATPSAICAGSASQLDVTAINGSGFYSYSWSSVPEGFTSDIRNPVVLPAETTRYVAHVNDGTNTITDTIEVVVFPFPIVNSGNDTSYCWWLSQFPVSGTAKHYSGLKWQTSGDGHFDFDTQLDVSYFPGDSDRITRSATLKLTAYGLEPCSDSISDELHVNFVCTGIPQAGNHQLTFTVEPNPSSGIFHVSISGLTDQIIGLNVCDPKGLIVYHDNIQSQQNELTKIIDLSDFPKGIYFLTINTDREQKSVKIALQ
jgi:hypothetical protein